MRAINLKLNLYFKINLKYNGMSGGSCIYLNLIYLLINNKNRSIPLIP